MPRLGALGHCVIAGWSACLLLISANTSVAAGLRLEATLVAGVDTGYPTGQGAEILVRGSDLFVVGSSSVLHWVRIESSGWTLVDTYSRPNAPWFGSSVAASGDGWLAVGDIEYGLGPGSVHIYRRGLDGHYSWSSTVQSPSPRTNGQFGRSIQIDGERLYVGAPSERNSEGQSEYRGGIHVFQRSTENQWEFLTTFRSPDPIKVQNFGKNVLVNSDVLVTSDPYAFVGPQWKQAAGVVYHCQINPLPATCWNVLGVGASYYALFGNALLERNEYLFVSATEDSESLGSVTEYLYDAGTFQATSVIGAPELARGWSFGTAIAASRDELFVSSLGSRVYGFRKAGNNWVDQQISLFLPDAGAPEFGATLALDSERLFVGAPGLDLNGWSNLGSVFIYVVPMFIDDFE